MAKKKTTTKKKSDAKKTKKPDSSSNIWKVVLALLLLGAAIWGLGEISDVRQFNAMRDDFTELREVSASIEDQVAQYGVEYCDMRGQGPFDDGKTFCVVSNLHVFGVVDGEDADATARYGRSVVAQLGDTYAELGYEIEPTRGGVNPNSNELTLSGDIVSPGGNLACTVRADHPSQESLALRRFGGVEVASNSLIVITECGDYTRSARY